MLNEFMKVDDNYVRVAELFIGKRDYTKDVWYKNPLSNWVLPYIGRVDNFDILNLSPGIYELPNGTFYAKRPKTVPEIRKFHMDNILVLEPNDIIKVLGRDVPVGNGIMYSRGDIFSPKLSIKDDVGMLVSKGAIKRKQFAWSEYDNSFERAGDKNNLKRAMTTTHSMTIKSLLKLCKTFNMIPFVGLIDDDGAAHPIGDKVACIAFGGNKEIDLTEYDLEVITPYRDDPNDGSENKLIDINSSDDRLEEDECYENL